MMKAVIAAVVLAALGWSGWWWAASSARETALEAWLAAREAEGWQAEIAAIETRGYPNRIDSRLEGLLLADPERGWAWRAPFLDILTLSYKPNMAIVAFPPEQSINVPGESLTLASAGLRASARLVPGPSLALARVSAEGEDLALTGAAGTATAAALALHLVEAEAGTAPPNSYRIYGELTDLRPPRAWLESVAPGFGAVVDGLKLDGRVALDAPLDRHALEDRPAQIEAISLTRLEARWGETFLFASGTVTADARGLAEGALDLRARNWRAALAALSAAGVIGRDTASGLELALTLFSGGGEEITVPLRFADGRSWLGPAPIGPAPALR